MHLIEKMKELNNYLSLELVTLGAYDHEESQPLIISHSLNLKCVISMAGC